MVALLESGAPLEEVISASQIAARQAFSGLSTDPMMRNVVALLAQLPLDARSPGWAAALERLGVDDPGSVPGLLAGISGYLDRQATMRGHRSEIARSALLSTLAAHLGRDLPGLFEPDARDIRAAMGRFASGDRFAELARGFFAEVAAWTLGYYLSRELANHTRPGRRFASYADRTAFDRALHRHGFEAARIVEDFAGGWYGKTVWKGDELSDDSVGRFTAYAMKKLGAKMPEVALLDTTERETLTFRIDGAPVEMTFRIDRLVEGLRWPPFPGQFCGASKLGSCSRHAAAWYPAVTA